MDPRSDGLRMRDIVITELTAAQLTSMGMEIEQLAPVDIEGHRKPAIGFWDPSKVLKARAAALGGNAVIAAASDAEAYEMMASAEGPTRGIAAKLSDPGQLRTSNWWAGLATAGFGVVTALGGLWVLSVRAPDGIHGFLAKAALFVGILTLGQGLHKALLRREAGGV